MIRSRLFIASAASAALVAAVAGTGRAADRTSSETVEAQKLFTSTVLPLLRDKCFTCHEDAQTAEAGLVLSARASMLAGGDSKRPALVPGQPEKSLLYIAAQRRNPKLAMPPEEAEKLADDELSALRTWIERGAPWVEEPKASASNENIAAGPIEMPTSGGLSDSWTHRKYQPSDVWAWQPPRRVSVPRVAGAQHPIDAFVRQKLTAKNLAPSKPADKATWLRRATIDLTGLPPSFEDVARYENDTSPDAAERLVDRLLASSHYGEQMARHWLDVVRYADTSGFSNDYERPHAWRYRDYVVRSFNGETPFDRFIVQQLAGDELDGSDPEMLVAAGFLRMGPWEHTSMSVAVETRQQFLDDVTHAVGATFLGLQLRCARCHDHKFDPLPTRDYYRLQSVFAPVQFWDRPAEWLETEHVDVLPQLRPRTERLLAAARERLASFDAKHEKALARWLAEHGHKSIDAVPSERRPPRHLGLSQEEMSLQKVYEKRAQFYEVEMRRYEASAFSVYNGPPVVFDMQRGVPRARRKWPTQWEQSLSRAVIPAVHILLGGSLASPGDAVTPGVLSAALAGGFNSPSAYNTLPDTSSGRRLALAGWIASEQNPLTARVIVNRVWQMHFGRGIVATSNNFGKMGARPTHPELLDWLATWFVEHGWSVKKLHRLIMLSDTYRQASSPVDLARATELDPRNELLSYFPSRRLAAEEIRDGALAASGELNPQVGGPPAFPELNWEVALQPRHIMGSVAPAYQPSIHARDRHRRTLYAFQCRTLGDPLVEVLNKPGSDISCERRDETIVVPQALALLNGQAMHDRALALARRLETLSADPGERVQRVYTLLYGRRPTSSERERCLAHVARQTAEHRTIVPRKVELPRSVRREMVEELTGETFSWDEELDQMAAFEPDLKPWDVGPETRAWAELCLVLLNSNEFLCLR